MSDPESPAGTDAPPLPMTSYAILGMLALRPWSAYELTRQLRRSLDYCWPTAESVWYSEPKRLVRLGLATAGREPAATGRRTRTVYAITGQGREVLAGWLARSPEPPRLQAETVLRLLYADQGSQQDLLTAVRGLQQWALGQAAAALPQIRGYLDDNHPALLTGRLHIIALIAQFHTSVIEQMLVWAEHAEAEILTWPSTAGLGMTPQARVTLEDVRARLEEHVARATAAEPSLREPLQ
jgi:PadR family transcriptional regulator, regulatory protein AphA